MEVEIRDKDSVLVYGPRELSFQEQKYQLLWWDGKDNGGEYTDPEKSPYLASVKLTYKTTKGERQDWIVRRSTTTNNAPVIVGVPILTRTNLFEIPINLDRYLESPRNLRFSTVLFCKKANTGQPEFDYACYHPNPYPGQQATIYYPWPPFGVTLPVTFNVKKWQAPLWGWLSHIRWSEVKPKIGTTANKVIYSDSIILGNWVYNNGFGWGWDENQMDMTQGTRRFRVHIEIWIGLMKFGEITTPKGIGLHRISTKGDYNHEIVKWASSYIDVPYVLGCNDNEYGQEIVKGWHRGYEGNDCSGLAGWSYVWIGEDLDENPSTPDSLDINERACVSDLKNYYCKDSLIIDDAQDGDMWFIDYGKPGTDHVGIFYYQPNIGPPSQKLIIHASFSKNEVENRLIAHFENGHWVEDQPWWFGDNFDGLGRRPHN